MERIKGQFMQERMEFKDLLKDYSTEIRSLMEKNEKLKETMELQKTAYLSKVNDLKKKIKKIETEAESQKNKNEAQTLALEEIKSKQNNFLHFLQTELASPIA